MDLNFLFKTLISVSIKELNELKINNKTLISVSIKTIRVQTSTQQVNTYYVYSVHIFKAKTQKKEIGRVLQTSQFLAESGLVNF